MQVHARQVCPKRPFPRDLRLQGRELPLLVRSPRFKVILYLSFTAPISTFLCSGTLLIFPSTLPGVSSSSCFKHGVTLSPLPASNSFQAGTDVLATTPSFVVTDPRASLWGPRHCIIQHGSDKSLHPRDSIRSGASLAAFAAWESHAFLLHHQLIILTPWGTDQNVQRKPSTPAPAAITTYLSSASSLHCRALPT